MQTLSPSVQTETEGTEGVGQAAHTESSSPEPLFSGPAPALWAGVGAFLLIFVIAMMLIIRGRVTRPAKRRAEAANKTYFEPAGEDADITFDEDAQAPAEAASSNHWRDEDVSETEVVIDHGGAQPEPEAEEEPLFDEPPAKPEKKKSAFAGLFSKKSKQEKEAPAIEEDVADEETLEADDGFFVLEQEAETEPEPAPQETQTRWREEQARKDLFETASANANAEQQQRIKEAEEAARMALKRAEEAEALARDLERANEEAKNVMDVGLRKREAALDERANELLAMEKRLADLTHEFQERAEALQQAATPAVPAPLHAAAGDLGHGVSEAHFEEFADLMGERFDALRGAVNGAVEKLSRRIDAMPPSHSGAATATAARIQLSDLLGDALAPGRFKLAHRLSTGRTADALLIMPGPMAPIAIDARFPVEAFDAWQLSRNAGTETELRRAILRHIADGAEKLISADETADCAMMFVPSENILSELHAHFSDLVQESYRARVWMVSPTSLMATLHTISAVMAGAGIKEMSAVNVIDELHSLRGRVAALETGRKNGAGHTPTDTPAEPEKTPAPKPAPAQYSDVFENPPEIREPSTGGDKPAFPLR